MPSLFSHLFNRFQFRLFLYLLLVISMPFLLSLYLFDQQFSANSQKEFMSSVDQKHDQMLMRMNQEFRYASEITHRNADRLWDYKLCQT